MMNAIEAYEVGIVDGAVAYAAHAADWRTYLYKLDWALGLILGDA